jgi:hypothetical protein
MNNWHAASLGSPGPSGLTYGAAQRDDVRMAT